MRQWSAECVWLRHGRQKMAIARAIRKAMTVTEILLEAGKLAPKTRLRDVRLLIRKLERRGYLLCLNPTATSGRVYGATARGKTVFEEAFNHSVQLPDQRIDWHAYSYVARGIARRAVFLEIAREPIGKEPPKTATHIRRALRDTHPLGLNPTIRALQELENAGLIQCVCRTDKRSCKVYDLTRDGRELALAFGAETGAKYASSRRNCQAGSLAVEEKF